MCNVENTFENYRVSVMVTEKQSAEKTTYRKCDEIKKIKSVTGITADTRPQVSKNTKDKSI